ncbi:MAG: CLC_0170 family protein [Mahellales bacterium]
MTDFLERVLEIFNIWVIIMIIAAGVMGVFVDSKAMDREGYKKEALISRFGGMFFILFGIALIILTILVQGVVYDLI